MRHRLVALLALALIGAAALGCGGESAEQRVLEDLAYQVIVPRYELVAAELSALDESLTALCAGPSSEGLAAARGQWRSAREAWLRSAASWFGPVTERRSRGLIAWPVTEPERIEALLESGRPLGPFEVRETLSSSQRGLGAIEYLIFDAADDGGALDRLTASTPRCAFLVALGRVAADEAEAVRSRWSGDDGEASYADVMTGAAKVSITTEAAVADVVRTSIFQLRTLGDMQLGTALGITGAEPDPTLLGAGPGQATAAGLHTQVLGMRDLYLGSGAGEDLGVSALVRDLGEDADERARAVFDAALAALEALEEPLPETIEADPAAARAAYDRLKELQRVIETEVVSLLGITIGFADTDGDSG